MAGKRNVNGVLELCERWRNGSVKERTVSFSVRYSIMKENYQSVTLDTCTNLTMDIYHVCKRIL
ncbi:DinB/UmuC family translesion DNA polymerase [Parageobacillus thermoglucosidasius]|uniref:DinB/UmuC family translesion DNA polymerase n=1 Tax=Parageobacillus thermoglucosidasius TaxID=1426 RepID=UPI0030C661AF